MASVSTGWRVVMSFVDTGGNETTRTAQLVATDTAGDATAVFADVATIVAAYVAATDAALKGYFVAKNYVEDALTLPAAAEVENNLQITAKIDGIPNKSATIEIPAPKVTMFQQTTGVGYNQPDFADSLLAAIVNLYDDNGIAYVSDGERITAQGIKGKRVHHKSNKG